MRLPVASAALVAAGCADTQSGFFLFAKLYHSVEFWSRLGYTGFMDTKDEKKTTSEKPVSLAPLTFQEALAGLLKVKPEPKPTKKPRKKSVTKKQPK